MKVLIAGDFGVIHQGHLDHIIKAYLLGDWLYVVTHTDESIEQRKGYHPIPLWARMLMLRGIIKLLGGEGEVVLAPDEDGRSVQALRVYRPDIFAKGGEYNKENMPQEELDVCGELGIQIVYGVGERLAQSRELI